MTDVSSRGFFIPNSTHQSTSSFKEEVLIERVITDNLREKIVIKWDGTRFALVSRRKNNDAGNPVAIIILNPVEMMVLVKFASTLGRE